MEYSVMIGSTWRHLDERVRAVIAAHGVNGRFISGRVRLQGYSGLMLFKQDRVAPLVFVPSFILQ